METTVATNVLVVDDEPQVVWMLRFSLEAEGYRTICAVDGRGALEQIRRHRPKVVLLDIMMPVTDGWTVLEELRAEPEEDRPRVIVVSARASARDRVKAIDLGADAFVAKPFNMDDLLGVVRELERVG